MLLSPVVGRLLDHRFFCFYNAGMFRPCLIVAVVFLIANCVHAQTIQQQTVQLPTFHYFGVETTVVVPTGGTIPLGSVTRSAQVRTPFDRVGSSFNMVEESLGLSMGVTVIDNAEIDRQILAEAARRRGAKVDVLGRPIDANADGDEPTRNERFWDRRRESGGGAVYMRRGREAELAGQPELAKVFYRRAAKLGNVVEKRAAEERLLEPRTKERRAPGIGR
jgi:hypothetical protein